MKSCRRELACRRAAVFACFLIAGFVLMGTVGAQSVSLTRESPPELLLGQPATWTIQAFDMAEKPLLATLPDLDGASLSQQQDEIYFDDAIGRWSAQWMITLTAERAGVFELPAVTVLAGTKSFRTDPSSIQFVRDERGGRFASFEWRPLRPFFWEGQVIAVEARLSYNRAFFAENVLQPFRRPLDMPVTVTASWLADTATEAALPAASDEESVSAGGTVSLVVNDAMTRWARGPDETRGGNVFGVVSQVFRRPGMAAGQHRLPLAIARFFFAEEFEEDFLQGRVAKERHEAFAYAVGTSIDIRALPEAGRPDTFSGAVGSFQMDAALSTTVAEVDDSLTCVVTIRGDGDRSLIRAPQWPPTPGFRLQGVISQAIDDGMRFQYDLLALSPGKRRVPALEFSYFDPQGGGAYAVARTQLRVLHVEGEASSEARIDSGRIPGVNDIFDFGEGMSSPGEAATEPPGVWLRALLWLLPWCVGGALLRFVLVSEKERRDPLWARSRRALQRYRSARRTQPGDLGPVLASYLTAKMRLAESDVYGPGLAENLRRADISADLAQEAEGVFLDLVHGRFGGPQSKVETNEVDRLVHALEREFSRGWKL